MKRLMATTATLVLLASLAMAADTEFGHDVCGDGRDASTWRKTCVGKTAYATGDLPVGKVVGVVYKKKGSCRSTSCQILAERDGFYLVVEDSMGQLTKDPRETDCR